MSEDQKNKIAEEKEQLLKIRTTIQAGQLDDRKAVPLYGIAIPLYGIAVPLYGIAKD